MNQGPKSSAPRDATGEALNAADVAVTVVSIVIGAVGFSCLDSGVIMLGARELFGEENPSRPYTRWAQRYEEWRMVGPVLVGVGLFLLLCSSALYGCVHTEGMFRQHFKKD